VPLHDTDRSTVSKVASTRRIYQRDLVIRVSVLTLLRRGFRHVKKGKTSDSADARPAERCGRYNPSRLVLAGPNWTPSKLRMQPSHALPVELLTTSRVCLGLFARRRSWQRHNKRPASRATPSYTPITRFSSVVPVGSES